MSWLPPRDAQAAEPAADDVAVAKAREEYRRGLALEAANDWTGALAAFKSVALVKSTPQVRFHIAQCEEKTGDYVGASGSYQLALYEAQQAKVKDVEEASKTALAALEAKIPKLTLKRGPGAEMAVVTMDGRELGPTIIGTEMTANPGPHHIEAKAPSREPRALDITLAEAEAKTVEIALDPLKAPEPDKPPPPKPELKQEPPPPPPPPAGMSSMRKVGIAVGGAGVVSLGVGAVFFAMRQSAISDLDAQCGADRQSCPASAAPTRDKGQLYTTLANALGIGGGVAAAAGLSMILFAPNAKAAQPAVGVAPFAPGSLAGASVAGRF